MNEATVKAGFVALVRGELPTAVVYRHEDRFSAGVPDISVSWNGRTSWWEVKWAHPGFECGKVQHIMMLRLEKVTIARYLIYANIRGEKTTHVVLPSESERWRDSVLAPGFDHKTVLTQLKALHGRGLMLPEKGEPTMRLPEDRQLPWEETS